MCQEEQEGEEDDEDDEDEKEWIEATRCGQKEYSRYFGNFFYIRTPNFESW